MAPGAETDLLPIVMKKASYGNTLNTLFCHFYSLCISEENESDIWNNIALITESNDGKYEKQSVQQLSVLCGH